MAVALTVHSNTVHSNTVHSHTFSLLFSFCIETTLLLNSMNNTPHTPKKRSPANNNYPLTEWSETLTTSQHTTSVGRDSSVGIATHYGLDRPGSNPGRGEIFRTRPDRPWGLPSLLYNGYRVFTGVKWPGRGIDHPPHLAPRLKKE